MGWIIILHTMDGEILYHNRGRLSLVASTFKTQDGALRIARQKYSSKLGYSLRSWTVTEQHQQTRSIT